jgi:hypothetical protein
MHSKIVGVTGAQQIDCDLAGDGDVGKREVINEVQESERDLLEGYNPNLHGEIRRERSGTQPCALFPHARVSGERTREQTTRETLSRLCGREAGSNSGGHRGNVPLVRSSP